MTREEVFRTLSANLPALREKYSVKTLSVFGSFATGTQTDTSDIDILVEFDRSPGTRFVEFCEAIEQLVQRKTDILTKTGVESIRNPRIAKRIKEKAIDIEAR